VHHGEDVKECYFYLDATPTSSYLKMLYKYPQAEHSALGTRWLYADQPVPVLVTGNETNNEQVFGSANETSYVKDGIDRAVVHGDVAAVDPSGAGTKAALHYRLMVQAGGSVTLRIRLTDTESAEPVRTGTAAGLFADFDELMSTRRGEADEFWGDVTAGDLADDERLVVRQALAGMLWSKQYYALDVQRWLAEHGADPLAGGGGLRNHDWRHLIAEDIISMPDTWEYPWFAAWDLAFHAVALAVVDVAFAKQQLSLLLNRRYLHPNGQLPAHEWNFSDVNPPVHAWATLFVYEIEEATTGEADRAFLEDSFQELMRNFSWWLNRKDADNRNIFQGGFLGLDNIGVFDRSAPLPGGGWIDQADGTAWMALYCQNMMQIALELALENPVYLEQAQALLENFAWIAAATSHVGPDGISLWDEQEGFFYDVLRRPDGSSVPLKVRSLVGLMPLAAATAIGPAVCTEFRTFLKDADGRRPVHGGQPILQSDLHWRDLLLFYEYFHGDNGAGIGASHQTGWTGTAGLLPLLFRGVTAEGLRTGGRDAIKSAAAGRRTGAAR
jgi:hypothetical protein